MVSVAPSSRAVTGENRTRPAVTAKSDAASAMAKPAPPLTIARAACVSVSGVNPS